MDSKKNFNPVQIIKETEADADNIVAKARGKAKKVISDTVMKKDNELKQRIDDISSKNEEYLNELKHKIDKEIIEAKKAAKREITVFKNNTRDKVSQAADIVVDKLTLK